jgi:diguanylate cyclase (GGDEF)-like protein/PAS domain S-box-containing protein
MEDALRVLMIENQAGDANLIEGMLAEAENSGRLPGLSVHIDKTADFSQGLNHLEQSAIDSILIGPSTPDDLSELAELRQKYPGVPVVACVTPENESLALLAMAQGATDYLLNRGGDPRSTALVVRHVKDCARLYASQKRLNWLEEHISEVVWRAAPDFRILEITPSIYALTGFSVEEATGKVLAEWLTPDSQWALEDIRKALPALIRTEDPTWSPTLELEHLRKDNTTFWCEISLKPILGPDDQITGWTGVTRDISSRHNIQEKLDYLSMHDPLTGLFNRAYFLEELKRLEFSRLYPITIMLADLEGLNKINYQYNISSGDELVKHAAALLRTVFRSEDMVARISGDEFIALMPRCSARAAEKALQRVVNMVEAFNQEQPDLPLSLSLGIATAESGQSLADTLKLANSLKLSNKVAD